MRKMAVPIQTPIIAVTMEALVTGAYYTTFLLCVRWLTLGKNVNRPMFIITILLFALSMTDLGLSLHSTLLASQGIDTLLYSTITVCNSSIESPWSCSTPSRILGTNCNSQRHGSWI